MPVIQKVVLGNNLIYLLDLTKIHPAGNKYFKLKHNLVAAEAGGFKTLLSFGGAWSNHLHALARIGADQGFKTIGVVRGEEPETLSAMLEDARDAGMHLVFISRSDYRRKTEPAFIDRLTRQFGECYILPEGGTNPLAIDGAAEIHTYLNDFKADYLCAPVGTGGTLAGLVNGASTEQQVLGFSVLKGAKSLDEFVKQAVGSRANWRINHQFHCGGYARCPEYLKTFILEFEQTNQISIEPVYTAKMLFGIQSLLQAGELDADARIVALLTGGLQGRRGYDF